MVPMRIICLVACIAATVVATPHQGQNHNGKRNSLNNLQDPSNWVSQNEINQLPPLNDVTLKNLEQMSVEDGATWLDKLYHLGKFNQVFAPTHAPKAREMKGYVVRQDGTKDEFNMDTFVDTLKRQQNFGNEEVTIFIQGLPTSWSDVRKANNKMVQAYAQRYNLRSYPGQNTNNNNEQQTSSEEQQQQQQQNNERSNSQTTGNLVVINLGDCIRDFEQYVTLDVERIGKVIGDRLVKLTNEMDLPQEIIHLVGQSFGAHVAGIAGREYSRQTGHKLRRITGLDPAKLYAKPENTVTGLARGDADFVDAIHTSAYGMGTATRCGDVDFYPSGPEAGVPGAKNVVEASLRATRYFAESVRPGNERNFPAVAATSFKDYKQDNGYGKRTYMGINASYDIKGDYILQVNPKSPFGRNAPAKLQSGYHNVHDAWKSL